MPQGCHMEVGMLFISFLSCIGLELSPTTFSQLSHPNPPPTGQCPWQNSFEFSFYRCDSHLLHNLWGFLPILLVPRNFEKFKMFRLELYLFLVFPAHHWLKQMFIIFLTHDSLGEFHGFSQIEEVIFKRRMIRK